MISFALRCSKDHRFESWFSSSAAFDALTASRHLACPICGDRAVEKALMAPAVSTSQTPAPAIAPNNAPNIAPSGGALSKPRSEVEQAMAQMRAHVEANSDYVGMNFAAEARAMHSGEAPTRAIYGEAKLDEARALLEDGVPVAPLPFIPRAKSN